MTDQAGRRYVRLAVSSGESIRGRNDRQPGGTIRAISETSGRRLVRSVLDGVPTTPACSPEFEQSRNRDNRRPAIAVLKSLVAPEAFGTRSDCHPEDPSGNSGAVGSLARSRRPSDVRRSFGTARERKGDPIVLEDRGARTRFDQSRSDLAPGHHSRVGLCERSAGHRTACIDFRASRPSGTDPRRRRGQTRGLPVRSPHEPVSPLPRRRSARSLRRLHRGAILEHVRDRLTL